MSDINGEKMCPLCTEEMDITDQQLKPCKCGYEMCVWCWHHIMDLAKKDESQSRCPACRTPYDTEKIVGMEAYCGKSLIGMNLERRQKVQKAKLKAFEVRKDLSDVRVIQRNLVYIIGFPVNLANEELLKRWEYFGQYGKVLKVSISRTASGVIIQHFSNNSCCVYITYSNKEEAIRCIQSVHNFILDGRSLRACFGTSKYCYSWLRNMLCNNSDCVFLHDFGSPEDSFSKHDVVSAFTLVHQIVGATNYMHRRSGNVLPPPADECSSIKISSPTKPVAKNLSNLRELYVDGRTGSSNFLPASASWVQSLPAGWPSVVNLTGSCESPKQEPEKFSDSLIIGPEDAGTKGFTFNEANKSMMPETSNVLDPLKSNGPHTKRDWRAAVINNKAEVSLEITPTIIKSRGLLASVPTSKTGTEGIVAPLLIKSSLELTKESCSPGLDKDGDLIIDGKFQSLCSNSSSISVKNSLEQDHSIPLVPNSSICIDLLVKQPGNEGSEQHDIKLFKEPSMLLTSEEAAPSSTIACFPREGDLQAFDDQGLKGSEGICHPSSDSFSHSLPKISSQSSHHSWQQNEICNRNILNADPRILPREPDESAFPFTSINSVISNKFRTVGGKSFSEPKSGFECSSIVSDVGKDKHIGRFDNSAAVESEVAKDVGENNIISNILSMDLDAWDDSLTSPHNLAKWLTQMDYQHSSCRIASLQKIQNCKESRFSFARQENFSNQNSDLEQSASKIRSPANKCSARQNFMENNHHCLNNHQKLSLCSSSEEFVNDLSYYSSTSSNKLSGVSRAGIPTPPGFSVPSRTRPAGVFLNEGVGLPSDTSANHAQQNSMFLGGQFQAPLTGNIGCNGDAQFINPASLAVSKGVKRANFETSSRQLSPFQDEGRLELLMHQSAPARQNLGLSGGSRNMFSSRNDAYGVPLMGLDESKASHGSLLVELPAQQIINGYNSNSHWGGWNEVKSIANLGISELPTSHRAGFVKFVPGYEDTMLQIPDFDNQRFGR